LHKIEYIFRIEHTPLRRRRGRIGGYNNRLLLNRTITSRALHVAHQYVYVSVLLCRVVPLFENYVLNYLVAYCGGKRKRSTMGLYMMLRRLSRCKGARPYLATQAALELNFGPV
jgi:hypothetical protein